MESCWESTYWDIQCFGAFAFILYWNYSTWPRAHEQSFVLPWFLGLFVCLFDLFAQAYELQCCSGSWPHSTPIPVCWIIRHLTKENISRRTIIDVTHPHLHEVVIRGTNVLFQRFSFHYCMRKSLVFFFWIFWDKLDWTSPKHSEPY